MLRNNGLIKENSCEIRTKVNSYPGRTMPRGCAYCLMYASMLCVLGKKSWQLATREKVETQWLVSKALRRPSCKVLHDL